MAVLAARRWRWARVEWPTVVLAAAIYGGWIVLTFHGATIPAWLAVPAGGWLIAWHSSLQHEVLHGHPTRTGWLNTLIGLPPIGLWCPYHRYRDTHLQHHRNQHLTDPHEDPESRYLSAAAWARLGPAGRLLQRVRRTLLGHLLLGPAAMIGGFLAAEAQAGWAGDRRVRRAWAIHLAASLPVLAWLWLHEMNPWTYAGMIYAGTALTQLRVFAEHRAAADWRQRTASVEGGGPLAWLFLFNNLHVAHHSRPGLAWYRLPAYHAANRGRFAAENGGLVYRGYGEIARRFLLWPAAEPVHPGSPR